MKIRHLEVFWAVMRTGSEHGAARLLNISQPAVSKLLRYAEDKLGMPMFERTKGRLYPTDEANRLYPEVDAIFGRIEGVERLAHDMRDSLSGRLKVAAIPTLAAAFLPNPLSAFLRERPLVKVGLKILPTALVIDRIANRQVDLGIVYGPVEDPAIETVTLPGSEIVCVMPKDHPLAGKSAIEPSDLAGERLISVNSVSPWGLLIEQAFQACGVQREAVVECNHAVIAYALVEARVGIAVVDPMLPPGTQSEGLRILPFRPRLEISPLVLHRRGHPLPRLCAAFLERLRAEAERIANPFPISAAGSAGSAGTPGPSPGLHRRPAKGQVMAGRGQHHDS